MPIVITIKPLSDSLEVAAGCGLVEKPLFVAPGSILPLFKRSYETMLACVTWNMLLTLSWLQIASQAWEDELS